MDYTTFKDELKSELSGALEERGHAVDIADATAHKANRDLDGITVRLDGATVSPAIYTESTFEQLKDSGMSMHEIVEQLADTVERAYEDFQEIGFDPTAFDADYIREHSYIAVVSTKMNEELLSSVPHEEIPGTDLSAYARIHAGEHASITIDNNFAFSMGMTGTEILDCARENTIQQGFSVQSMQETLTGLMPEGLDGIIPFPQEERPSMCVITNEAKHEGASSIISSEALDRACEKMGCETAVILPSSRHELLAVNPDAVGMGSTAELKTMVEEVNATQVSLEDKLSDMIYEYNSKSHELTLCNEEGLFPTCDIDTDMGMQMYAAGLAI